MSTRTGTLQAPRATRSIWPAAVIASLLMLSIGIGAFALSRDQATSGPKTVVGRTEQTVVGGTAANTPSELSGGIRHKFVSETVGTNTPTELTGGIVGGLPAEFYDRHQRA